MGMAYTQNEKEWNEIKTVLTNKPILAYFDPRKQTKISSDASRDALGAVIMQLLDSKWLPSVYAARSMTDAECRYAQIEKDGIGTLQSLSQLSATAFNSRRSYDQTKLSCYN